jgi:chromosome segregation ATPase
MSEIEMNHNSLKFQIDFPQSILNLSLLHFQSALVDSKSQLLSLEAQLSTLQSRCTDYQEQVDGFTIAKKAATTHADAQELLVLHLKEQEAKLLLTQKSLEAEKGRLKESCDSLKAEVLNVNSALKLTTKVSVFKDLDDIHTCLLIQKMQGCGACDLCNFEIKTGFGQSVDILKDGSVRLCMKYIENLL